MLQTIYLYLACCKRSSLSKFWTCTKGLKDGDNILFPIPICLLVRNSFILFNLASAICILEIIPQMYIVYD